MIIASMTEKTSVHKHSNCIGISPREDIDASIERQAGNTEARETRGVVLEYRSRLDAAATAHQKALALSPTDKETKRPPQRLQSSTWQPKHRALPHAPIFDPCLIAQSRTTV